MVVALARRDEVIAALRAIVPGEGTIVTEDERRAYETDGLTAYRQLPIAVVLPSTTEQVSRVLKYCKEAGVKLMYAEELCFTPKYVRAKQLVDEGALGRVYLIKQSEKHFGPHSAWF